MNYSTTNSIKACDIVRITEQINSGIHSRSLRRIAIGYILSGTKYIHSNDICHQINAGDIFLLNPGIHYEENNIERDGQFKQITFYLSPESLQQVIFSLNINYGLTFSSRHSCRHCSTYNFAIAEGSTMLRNFFTSIDLSLRNNGLLHNDVGQRIKLNELIYLIMAGEDNCIRQKLLRSTDVTTSHFINTIYENIFNDISIDALATLTNRSLTSFKKEFKRLFNSSPHHWIITQRLDRAKIMLSSTNLTVSEVGAECGFANISHFIKLFKQRYQNTPANFRRLLHLAERPLRAAVGE